MDTLLTWVGSRDPSWDNHRTGRHEFGPILSLLNSRKFDTVYLFFNLTGNADDFRQRANALYRYCQREFPSMHIVHRPVDLVSVIDYREIFRVMNHECQSIIAAEQKQGHDLFAYLSPGTPQMQTVWVLLVQSGLLPAKMIDTTPRDLLAPGAPAWREIDLSLPDLPQVVDPGETARIVGILESQNENLMAMTQRLQAELDVWRAGGAIVDEPEIGDGFDLREYLVARERLYYVLALEQADGNASRAARILGIEPPAFRARAETLRVRQRRHPRNKS